MEPQVTGKVWAIGDIHGQAELLNLLLRNLPRAPQDTTVFLGDYIDRGPASRGVVERLLLEHDRAPDRTILLWGNHEAIAAAYFGLPNPLEWEFEEPVHAHDGLQATLDSFGISGASGRRPICPQSLQQLFSFLRLFWRIPAPGMEHVIFVHAGIPPGRQPEECSAEELLMIRKEFTQLPDDSGRLVVFGHTSSRTVFQRPDKIGIDTGAGYGGSLAALELPRLWLHKASPDGRVAALPLLTADKWKL